MIEIEVTPDEEQLSAAVQLAANEIDRAGEPADGIEAEHETYLNLSESETWVALVDGIVKGMIAFRIAGMARAARIDALAINPDSRFKKLRLGSALLEYFEAEMAYRGIGRVSLESLPDATGFYEEHEYIRVGAGNEFEKHLE